MTVLAIDASFLLHRVRFVLQSNAYSKQAKLLKNGYNEDTAKSEALSIITGTSLSAMFMRSVVLWCERFHPSSIYVLWDIGACSYRTALYDDYKDRNVENTDDFQIKSYQSYVEARDWLHDNLSKLHICSLMVPGIEADDFGYYISHTHDSGYLISDDRDWYLNLCPGWTLFRPMGDEMISYNQFDWDQNRHHYIHVGTPATYCDPRYKYMVWKACMGDKTEIPRLATPKRAEAIAAYICNETDTISDENLKILKESTTQYEMNLKLADTSWLITNPDLSSIARIHIEEIRAALSTEAIQEFFYTLSLFNYVTRWKSCNKNLELSLPSKRV